VQRYSLRTLRPYEWLNDEVIHYFLVTLQRRDVQLCQEQQGRKRTHFFKSFFMTKLLDEGNVNPALDGTYCYNNVKRWSKKVPGGYLCLLLKGP
jgi:Ulp1 family protease